MESLDGLVDIVEVGTPLMMRYGLGVIGELKSRFPSLTVLCDTKIMDAAAYEAALAFDAGADWVTVLAVTDDASIRGCVDEAHRRGRRVMADMICAPDLGTRARVLETMGVNCVAVHTGVDQQAAGRTPLDDLRTLATVVQTAAVAVAGGITEASLAGYLALHPDIVIVGGGITRAQDPVAATRALRSMLDSADEAEDS